MTTTLISSDDISVNQHNVWKAQGLMIVGSSSWDKTSALECVVKNCLQDYLSDQNKLYVYSIDNAITPELIECFWVKMTDETLRTETRLDGHQLTGLLQSYQNQSALFYVFGKFIGDSDHVLDIERQGKLLPVLQSLLLSRPNHHNESNVEDHLQIQSPNPSGSMAPSSTPDISPFRTINRKNNLNLNNVRKHLQVRRYEDQDEESYKRQR